MLSATIQKRVTELGGQVICGGATLQECLQNLEFSGETALLLFADWADYVEPDVIVQIVQAPDRARKFITSPPFVWGVRLFTPFTQGTSDHEEWAGTIDQHPLVALCGVESPEVIFIGHSQGWPNDYFVVVQDPTPENPTVYTTDHEVYFSEIEVLGPLSDLLDSVLTLQEFDAGLAVINLVAAGWQLEPAPTLASEAAVGTRHPLGHRVQHWTARFTKLSSADDTVWFLSNADYNEQETSGFGWKTFELQTLADAMSENQAREITKFWNTHLPILMSVKGTYEYLAIAQNGTIVHGAEPEFEETTMVAPSFAAFVSHLATRPARGEGTIEQLVLWQS